MFLANTNTYTGKQRKLALSTIFTFLFSVFTPTIFALGEFVPYSTTLQNAGLISRELVGNAPIISREALQIAIGLGGYPSGCGPTLSTSCNTDSVARSRGLLSTTENTLANGIIRANAIKLVLKAANITPSTKSSNFSDVDGKLSASYVGYIAKARELQCIQATDTFRPFDYTSEGEYAKMAVCALKGGLGEVAPTFPAAPSNPNPPSSSTPSFIPAPAYFGGGGSSTTVVNNYYTSSFTGIIGDFTSTGTANLNNANFTNTVNFSLLPSLPLGYGSMLVGNSANRAIELTAGSSGQVLSMVGNVPTWINLSLPTGTGGGLVDSVFGRIGAVTAQSADYNTDLVTEASNLYFTNTRAQNALSGTIATLSGLLTTTNANLATATGNLATLSGALANLTNVVNTLSGIISSSTGGYYSGTNYQPQIDTLSGQVALLSNQVTIFAFTLGPVITVVNSFSGTVGQHTADIASLSGNLSGLTNSFNALSGTVSNILSNISVLSGVLAQNTTNISTLSGTLNTLSGTVSTMQSDIAALQALSHPPVTLGTANGLTLSGQQLSLTLASATTTGALSVSDWITFNSKINLTSLSAGGPILYNNTTGVFSWSGTTTDVPEGTNLYWTQSRFDTAFGLKSTTNLTEGSNLYFTDTRAQNALSGTILGIRTDLTTATGNIASLFAGLTTTNANLATATGNIATLSGVVSTLSSQITSVSGSLTALTTTVSTLSGVVSQNISDINTLSGGLLSTNSNLSSLSGVVSTLTTTISSLSGSLSDLASVVTTLSGQIALNTTNISTLSGTVSTISNTVSALSGTVSTILSNVDTLSGLLTTTNANLATATGNILTLQQNLATATGNIATLSGQVATLSALSHAAVTLGTANGLTLSGQQLSLTLASSTTTGALSATDWNTFNSKINLTSLSGTGFITYNNTTGVIGWTGTTSGISEGTNLYFTDTRAQNALSGTILGIRTDLATATGNILTLQQNLATATGNISTLSGGLTTLSGVVTSMQGQISTLSGTISGLSTTVSALSGSLTSLTATVDALSGVVAGNTTSINALSGSLLTTNNTLSTLSGVVSGLSTTVSALSGSLTSLTTTVNSLSGQTVTNTTNIATLSGALSTLTSTVDTLSGSLSSVTSQVATLSGSLGAVISSLASLSGTVAANTADITTLSGNLATLSSVLTTTNASLANATGQIASLSGTVATLLASSHPPVTLGTANGLTLSGQQLSLTLASATTTGALSVSDWITFNSKINLTSLSAGGPILYNNTTGVFSWSGTTTDVPEGTNLYWTQSRFDTAFGLKSTTNLTEGSNLYFTDTRAQNALSGTISGIQSQINTLSGSIATLGATVNSLSGVVASNTTNINALSGSLATTNSALSSLSGVVSGLSTNLATLSGSLATLSTTVNTLSGQLVTNTNTIASVSGALSALTTTVNTISGSVLSLSGTVSTLVSSLTTTNANLATATGNILTLQQNLATATGNILTLQQNLATATGNIATANSNIATITGQLVTINNNIATATGNIATLSGNIATLSGQVAALSALSHAAVTLGSANGLTLSGQQISLTLASISTTGALSVSDWISFNNRVSFVSGTANGLSISGSGISLGLASSTTTGALSASDWNTFNSKINLTSLSATGGISYNSGTGLFSDTFTFNNGLSRVGNTIGLVNGSNGQVLTMSGGAPVWLSPGAVSIPVNSVFGRTGAILGVAGDYNTSLVTESGSLYFTDTRAQNALSGTILGIRTNLATATGNILTLQQNLATATGNITTLFTNLATATGQINTLNTNVASITGQLVTINSSLATATGNISTLSGSLATLTTTVNTLSGNLNTLSGILATTNANLATATGNILTLQQNLATATGNISTLSGNLNTLSGVVATKISLTSLSGTGFITYNNTTGVIGWTGTTSGISEGTNLYFTNARAIAAPLTGFSAASGTVTSADSILQAFQKLQGSNTIQDTIISNLGINLATATGQITTLQTNLATATGNIATITGQLVTINSNIATATGNIATLSGNISTLSGNLATTNTNLSTTNSNLATATGNILTLQQNLATATGNIATLSGNLSTLTTTVNTLSGNLSTINTNLTTLSGVVATKIGLTSLSANGPLTYNSGTGLFSINIANSTTTGAISVSDWISFNNRVSFVSGTANGLSISGSGISLGLASSTTTGALSATDWNTFNSKINLTSLSATGGISYNSGTGLFSDTFTFNNGLTRTGNSVGLTLGSNGQYLSMSGGAPVWITIPSALVTSVFGRTGAILGVAGDYNTSLVTESGSLYFTNARAIGATLTGFTPGAGTVVATDTILQALQKLQGTNTLQDTNIATATGNILGIRTDLATATGNILTLQQNLATATGNISTLSGNLNTLSGVVATKIGLTSLSANGPLTYNSGTGLFSINIANSTTTGALSVADWNAFNNKIGFISGAPNGLSITGTGISLGLASSTTTGALSVSDWVAFNSKLTSLNGLTATGQTFAIGTAGNDFNIVSSGSVHTFNLPDASATARGVVSTGAQVFAGAKTFAVAPTLSGFTQGSILFAGTGGTIAQDNANIYYNGTTKRLGLGTNAPVATFHNSGSTILGAITISNRTSSGTIGTAATTVDIATTFNINQTGSNITLSLPTPTSTTAGRIAYVNNIGTTSFFFLGTQIIPNSSRTVIWNGTAWVLTGNADDRISGQYRKLADESIASNIVSQDDDHLSFSVSSGETWFFDISIIVRNGATGGARVRMNVPTGSTNCSNSVITNYNGAWFTNATCNTDIQITNLNNLAATSNSDEFSYRGVFTAGSTGVAKLQWAQRVSNATATIFLKDSTMVVTKLSGADVAEVYYAHDGSIREGEIVSLTGDGISQVKKSDTPYDSSAIGVISTKPGVVMGEADGAGKPVIVGLAGRVPVKVTTKNGEIKPGDFITTSDIPGVGMKATEAGRVIGKALTGLSGQESGTIAVFIQNTYFDGIDEIEYANTLGASGSLQVTERSLDRFSYMVKKSLMKIDPSYFTSGSSGALSGSIDVSSLGNTMTTLASAVSGVSTSLDETKVQVRSQADIIASLQSDLMALSGALADRRSATISSEDQGVLDAIISNAGKLSVQAETVFNDVVTFTDRAIFKSSVEFRGRVTFYDRDMAGTATIKAGVQSVSVNFSSPYAVTPKITASADDFVNYRITQKSGNGFTIELEHPATRDVSLDWIALYVKGASSTVSHDDPLPTTDIPPSVSGSVIPPSSDNSTGTTSDTGNIYTDTGSTPLSNSTTDSGTLSNATDPPILDPGPEPPPDGISSVPIASGAIAPLPPVPEPSPEDTQSGTLGNSPPQDPPPPVTSDPIPDNTTLSGSGQDPITSGSDPPTGPPLTTNTGSI